MADLFASKADNITTVLTEIISDPTVDTTTWVFAPDWTRPITRSQVDTTVPLITLDQLSAAKCTLKATLQQQQTNRTKITAAAAQAKLTAKSTSHKTTTNDTITDASINPVAPTSSDNQSTNSERPPPTSTNNEGQPHSNSNSNSNSDDEDNDPWLAMLHNKLAEKNKHNAEWITALGEQLTFEVMMAQQDGPRALDQKVRQGVLTQRKLRKQDDWPKWKAAEWKMMEQYKSLDIYSTPVKQ